MKLHLPLPLLKSLLLLTSFIGGTAGTANAICMHTDATFQTYADFGQNMGRYVVGNKVNALVRQIRGNDGGIAIQYTTGAEPYIIPNSQGMINLTATIDEGDGAMISPTFLASVEHVWSLNASFSQRLLGDEHRISYSAIDIWGSNIFRMNPLNVYGGNYDYVIERQSKVVTDATWNEFTTVTDINTLVGQHLYHSGAGAKGLYDASTGVTTEYGWAYQFITGGINQIQSVQIHEGTTNLSVFQYLDQKGASDLNPLPFAVRSGDSGSPSFIYNSENNRYEYLAGQQSYSVTMSQARGNLEYTREKLVQFDVNVEMPESGTLYLNAVNKEDETRTDNGGRTGTEWHGSITNGQGAEIACFAGVKTGLNTWASLHELKDTQNWYAYTSDDYLQVSDEDLFFTDNLLFNTTGAENEIILKDTVDLGIGYAGFSGGSYTIKSEGSEGNLFNHAGYVINAGAEVHLQLNNKADYMYEWRKTGAGDLYIDGQGDTNALLVLGGTGSTYLQQQGGHAAYNVLVGSGARVEIADKAQIVRDFTFGNGGGILDMNGNSMDWYTSGDTEGLFTINALSEEAIISNSSGHVTLTYRQSGENTWLGSFQDSATGSLRIDYQGGGVLVLHGIHTDLTQREGSGMTISNGRVVLAGTNTLHGKGSVNGMTGERLFKENDWHYADAAMNVTVKSGAVFELGSHARLAGDVTVESGGTYVMREGVHSQYEYVEGGAFLEDTSIYSDYFGHKGNISMAAGSELQIAYSGGTTSAATFAGNITGAGDVSVNLSTNAARLILEGENSFTGRKTLSSGGLVGVKKSSLGDTADHKWVLGDCAWIASHADTAQELLDRVDGSSTGTLALSADTEQKLDLSGHQNLYLGAEEGKTVNYGAAGTTEKLEAVQQDAEGNYVWKLGGGGGTLNVNYQLSGNHDLLLGSAADSTGFVYLGNAANDFTGNIIFNSQGIRLGFASGALGTATLNLIYGCGAASVHGTGISNLSADSAGILLLDNQPGGIDISAHSRLALGSSVDMRYTGNITAGEGQAYRFSVMDGATFTVGTHLTAGHDVIVDAQGYSGGTVVLERAADVTGAVTVMGHETGEGGSITLGLVADNALANASSVSVQNACVLDIADTTQAFNKIDLQAGSMLVGAEGSAVLIGSAADSALHGSIQADQLQKTGTGTLVLGAEGKRWNTFTIREGKVVFAADNALAGEGRTVVLSGATLDLNTPDNTMRTVNGDILLDGGLLLTGTTATDAYTRISGQLGVTAGKSAIVHGNHLELTNGSYNTTGGTMQLELSQLILSSGSEQHIGGTVDIAANMTLYSSAGTDNMLKRIDHLNVGGGKTLTVDENHWNTIWQFDQLTGEGDINWNSDTNHGRTARLVMGGTGEFSGNISMVRRYGHRNRTHQAYLQINGNSAVRDAAIDLQGGANSYATLALNADKVQLKGISGNEYTHVMLGDAPAGDGSAERTSAPASTRSSTLVLTGSGDYTFSGTIGVAENTAGQALSIVKTGTGSQTFNGAHAVLGDVTALQGTLNITTATVHGDVVLAAGANLTLGNTFVLGEGKSFTVQGNAPATTAATFNSTLVLDGGVLNLDMGSLAAGTAVLNLTQGARVASGVVLNLNNTAGLSAGSTYTLISGSGNWADLEGHVTINGLDYLSASMVGSSDGLRLSFTANEEYAFWNGTAENKTWSASHFGGQSQLTAPNFVFTDAGAGNEVQVEGTFAAGKVIFNSTEDYKVDAAAAGAQVTVETLEQNGSGTTTLSSAVKVTGDTLINDGTLVLEDTGILQGSVSGRGTLEIDWGKGNEGRVSLQEIGGLSLASGTLQAYAADLGGMKSLKLASDGRFAIASNANNTLSVELQAAGGSLSKSGNGTLTWNVSMASGSLDTVEVSDGALVLNLAGGELGISSATGDKLKKWGEGTLNLGSATLSELELKNGVSNISGTVNLTGMLSIGKGEVNMTDGAHLSVSQYRAGDTADGNPSVVTIGAGASLTVNGSNDVDDTNASFLLAHWKQSGSTLVLDGGALTAQNTRMLMGWNSGGCFEALAGTADLKGLRFSSQRGNADSFILGAAETGSAIINIGSGGITGMGGNDTVRLGRGTLRATADFSISGAAVLGVIGSGEGTILDTNGHTITVDTQMAGEGNLTKRGNGTLNLNAAASVGNMLVQGGGTLNIAAAVDIGSLEIGTQNVVLAAGADVSVNLLQMGTNARYQNTSLSIEAGAALRITGTGFADAERKDELNSLLLAHWRDSASTMVLNGGTLDAGETTMLMGWDSGGTFKVSAGEANLQGIAFCTSRSNADSLILGTADAGSARINIGSAGISGIGNNDTVDLGRGTIGATADFSITGSKALALTGTGEGTVFDTDGHSVTISSGLTGGGNLTKTGAGKLVLDGPTLRIGTVVVNGGTLELSSRNSKALQQDITVNAGATLAFAGTGADLINYDVSGKTITVDGGKVDFGTTRQSMGSWGLTLRNGATLTGEGAFYTSAHNNQKQADYSAAFDVYKDYLINVESGANSIGANIRLRDKKLTFDVQDKASVNVGGRIHYDDNRYTGTIEKRGSGSLVLSGASQINSISLKDGSLTLAGESKVKTLRLEAGEFSLSGAGAVEKIDTAAGMVSLVSTGDGEKQITTLDGSIGKSATGTLRLESPVRLKVSSELWGNVNSAVELAQGAELNHADFIFTNKKADTAVLKTSSADERYTISSTTYSLTDGYIKRTGGSATLRNLLVDSAVENAGNGVLKVYNSQNSLSGVHATTGAIRLFDQAEHHLQALSVGDGLELSAYTKLQEQLSMVAELRICGEADLGSGITINANLVLENSTVLDMGGTITLHGALNLQTGLTLDGTVLEEVMGLEKDQSCILFTGVTQLNVQQLEQSVTLFAMRSLAEQTEDMVSYDPLMDDIQVAACDYFSNLAYNRGLVLSYNSTDGTVSITNTQAVPEPATATLSLLALTALAARRRRK